ncbi:MAG: biotin/lipoyl-containing protein [Halanaerobiaceae bacterium]
MEKYIVKVNGREYEVEIVEADMVGADSSSGTERPNNVSAANISSEMEQKQSESSTDVRKSDTVSNEKQKSVSAGDLEPVKAPMSGTILSIGVGVGDRIEKGQTIMTLEAMKMETEISAPVSGEIADIKIGEGDNCENGMVIALIKEDG